MSGAYQFTVGGDFSEILRAFDRLDQRAQQSGQAIGKGIDEGVKETSLRSLAALDARLQRLRAQQTRIAVDSSAFDEVGRQIKELEGLIGAINRRRITLDADPGSVVALNARLGELNDELGRLAIGSQRFKDLQREIRGVEQALGRAAQAASAFRPNLGTAQGLGQELARLQRIQSRTTSGEGVEILQRRIVEVQGQIDTLNRRRLLVTADPGSVVALRAQLSALNNQIGEVAIGSRRFKELQREIQTVERDLRKAGEAGGIAAKGIGLVQGAIGLLGGVSIGMAVTGFFRESIQQAIQLETATRRLTNTLGPQGAAGALGFVRGVSDELGLSFRDLVGSYGRFTAAATAANVPLDQQQALFTAVSRAGMALGLSNDEVNGAFLALQQIASKGTVSMEELRQQLGERLPIALAATARGLGMSTKELIKLVETGQLSANRFFPAFTKGLNELTQGSQGMPTAAQNLQRFQNAWQELQVSFGQNLLPGITATVKQLTSAIEEVKVQGRGRDLGLGRGFLGGLSNEAAQLVGELDRVQKKFNLTDQQARNIFSESVAFAGGRRSAFGELIPDAKVYAGILDSLEGLAKRFTAGRRDTKSEELAAAAAAQALTQRLEEQAQAQQKLNATASQRGQISALEAEAALTDRVTAGKLSQVDADATLRRAQARTLREDVAGIDELISKLEAARKSGANNQKDILAAQSNRAQKVLEIAKLEAQGSQVELERRQKALALAETRLDITKQQLSLEDRSGQLAAARLRAQQQVLDAQLNLQQAQQGLTDSQFGVDRARQQFTLQTAEAELQALRDRGAGVADIRRQEDLIASLKRGATDIDRRALEAQINGAAQRFAIERQVLQLRQAQELIDAQAAQRAAASNVIEQRQRLLSLASQALDPSLNAGQISAIQDQITLQREALALAEQQQRAEAQRVPLLGTIFGLQNQALVAQQQTTANQLRTQAATQGWEETLAGPLQNLDQAGQFTQQLTTSVQGLSAGFITAGGETVNIRAAVDGIAGGTASAADAANALAIGYADANTQASALLETLRNIAATPQARWAGGPVDPATAYRVNELGQESLLAPGGGLSLINAPARSMWRPPSRGTVLPAGVTAALKAAGAFGRSMAPSAGPRLGNLEAEIAALRVEIRGLRQKDWNISISTPSSASTLRSVGGF